MRLVAQVQLAGRALRRRARPAPARRVILLHIGLHKTGTSYIQRTLGRNRGRLPLEFETVPRHHRILRTITALTNRLKTLDETINVAPELTELSQQLAQRFARVPRLLVTQEDLIGRIPSRKSAEGLYPFVHVILPALITGFEHSGAEVHTILYLRDFKDWQASLFRHKFINQPARAYAPKKFAARKALPKNWRALETRIRTAVGARPLFIERFEDDRATGLLGRALFERLGLSAADINNLIRIAPQNVSRSETAHDSQFTS